MTIGDDEEDLRQARLAAAGDLLPAEGLRPPEPGTGTISISPFQNEWAAIWDYSDEGVPDTYRRLEGPPGMTREQAIEWALEHPAERIFINDGEDWVPLTRS